MNQRAPSAILEMLKRCGSAGVLDDALGRAIVLAFHHGYASAVDHQELARRNAKLEQQEQLGLVPPFGLPRGLANGVLVAKDMKGNVVRVPADWLAGHVAIAGSTGAGKTTFGLFLLLALILSIPGAGFVLVDSYKQQFRSLAPPVRQGGREFIVIRGSKWKLNFLDPDGCDVRGHMQVVTDLLARELDLPSLAAIELGRAIYRAFAKFTALDSRGATEWPCLFDVYQIIYDSTDLNHATREVLLARLCGLLLQLTPACAAYRRAWRQSDLDHLVVVQELSGVSSLVRRVMVGHLLAATMHRRCKLALGSDPNLFIALDDAQRFLTKSALGSGLTTLAELLGLVRGAGVCLLALFQSYHAVDQAILANLNNMIVGRMAAEQDWSQCARQLGLNQDQLIWARRHLGPGTMLMRLANGHWREPFPIKTARLSLPPAPTDGDVDATLAALDHIPVVPAREYADWSPIPRCAVGKAPQATHAPSPSQTYGIDDAELRLLLAIASASPLTPSSELPKCAGLSPKRARQIRARLAQLGLVEEVKVQTGAAGRPTVIAKLTGKGEQVVAACRKGAPS